MGTFSFGGKTIVAPGILVSSEIGAQRVLQLLPFGTVAMIGPSDGGAGNGAIYSFNDTVSMQRVLRKGPLCDALLRAAGAGASSGFIAVVAGSKAPSTLALGGGGGGGGFVAGSKTVSPVSMANITVGQHLTVDAAGPYEDVQVTAITGSTFTAVFQQAHAAGYTVQSNPNGTTGGTVTEAITGTGSQQVTPSSAYGIHVGDQLVVGGETVRVTAITSTQFTAVFTQAHAAGATFAPIPVDTTVAAAMGAAPPSNAAGIMTSGDQGDWTTGINVTIVPGTNQGTVAVTISYPEPLSGQTVYIGGKGSSFDNLTLLSQLATLIAKNTVLTPPAATGLPAVVSLRVTTDGLPAVMAKTPLAGGTGNGEQTLGFNDYKAAIDAMIDVNFDIGHLVEVYDLPTQAYADAQAVQVATYGRLRRWIHQVQVQGVAAGQLKTINSQAVASALIGAATGLDSIRSAVVAQQVGYTDASTGTTTLIDAAPLLCGLASLKGATGANGPATPLTYESLPGALSVDFPVLRTTNDVDNAIRAGGIVLEQVGFGGSAAVRIVQSVTTAPNDASGAPWVFGEFSVVRASDALLANCIAALESGKPKTIGGGNTQAIMQAALSEVRDVLEDALAATWITDFDPQSITIFQTGIGEDDILRYSAAPTVPLNHIGIDQTLLPFQGPVALGGAVNG